MTKHSIEILLERVASWPESAQDEFVKSVAEIERKHTGIYTLSDDERAGRFSSDEAVAALFGR